MVRIYRPWIRTRDGRTIYAKDYGKKAFCFWVNPGEPAKKADSLRESAAI